MIAIIASVEVPDPGWEMIGRSEDLDTTSGITLMALDWGLASAVSLPAGAVIGSWTRPSRRVTSALMAFGGGAMLFALSP